MHIFMSSYCVLSLNVRLQEEISKQTKHSLCPHATHGRQKVFTSFRSCRLQPSGSQCPRRAMFHGNFTEDLLGARFMRKPCRQLHLRIATNSFQNQSHFNLLHCAERDLGT